MKESFKLNIIKSFFLVIVYSLILASAVFYYTVDKVVPNVLYKNVIDFELSFDADDALVFLRLPVVNETAKVSRYYVEKSEKLKKYQVEVPYDYVPFFVMSFGESYPINFALAELNINGQRVPIDDIAGALSKSGYIVEVKDNVLYANYKNSINELDLYNLFKDKFTFMTRDEVNANITADRHLRYLYYIVLSLFIYLILKLLIQKLKNHNHISDSLILISSFVILIFVANSLLYIKEFSEKKENVFYFIKNYSCLILFPLLVFFLAIGRNIAIRLLLFFISFAFLFIVGIDHFVQSVFGTRFLFSTVGTFAGTLLDGLPFIQNYITSYYGFYYICAVVVFSIMFWTKNKFINLSKIKLIFIGLFLMSVCALLVANSKESNRYLNTYQVNISGGWFSSGDYKREYQNFKRYTADDLKYQSYKGLAQNKSVIVLLVESLSCSVTHLCGNQNDYMPNLKQFAGDNVYFPNYYSNNVHTNGAIFTITTGFPLVSGKDMNNILLNESYYLNDVVNKFHKNGYVTSYYSPAKFVIDKDKQLVLSDYDVLSSSNDPYYDGFDKPGVFGSVSDENMFDKIISDLKKIKNKPVFIMLTTVSTHTPYITPWGSNNIETAFNYTDYAVTKFIKNLNDIKYFDNGVVFITGDHRDWGFRDSEISRKVQSRISREKVPLIMIDGVNHNIVWDRVSFSHSSLAVMLEYMMLPTYERNKYQINPIVDTNDELILYQNLNNMNEVIVKYGDREDTVVLDGDQTRFEGTLFNQYEQQQILGYISWLKR